MKLNLVHILLFIIFFKICKKMNVKENFEVDQSFYESMSNLQDIVKQIMDDNGKLIIDGDVQIKGNLEVGDATQGKYSTIKASSKVIGSGAKFGSIHIHDHAGKGYIGNAINELEFHNSDNNYVRVYKTRTDKNQTGSYGKFASNLYDTTIGGTIADKCVQYGDKFNLIIKDDVGNHKSMVRHNAMNNSTEDLNPFRTHSLNSNYGPWLDSNSNENKKYLRFSLKKV